MSRVESYVVVEIKTLAHLLTNDELAQANDSLTATGYDVGSLLNCGHQRVEVRHIFQQNAFNTIGATNGVIP